jgi:hypothetical protein
MNEAALRGEAMPFDQAEATGGSRRTTATAIAEHIKRWCAAIYPAVVKPTQYFFRSGEFAPGVNAARSAAREVDCAGHSTPKTSAAIEKVSTAPSADRPKAGAGQPFLPDQEEIQRRRDLVRMLFNDYWRGADEKPAAFSDRLDQAEEYLNQRLAAAGEIWRLDADTRGLLGLPPRSSLAESAKNHAARI